MRCRTPPRRLRSPKRSPLVRRLSRSPVGRRPMRLRSRSNSPPRRGRLPPPPRRGRSPSSSSGSPVLLEWEVGEFGEVLKGVGELEVGVTVAAAALPLLDPGKIKGYNDWLQDQ